MIATAGRPLIPEASAAAETDTVAPQQQRHRNSKLGQRKRRRGGWGLFPLLLCQWHFRQILCVTTAARRRDDSARRAAAVASELFLHAVPSLCCAWSTMLPIGQLLRCGLTSALVIFLRRLYVGTIQKTSGSNGSRSLSQARLWTSMSPVWSHLFVTLKSLGTAFSKSRFCPKKYYLVKYT